MLMAPVLTLILEEFVPKATVALTARGATDHDNLSKILEALD
jgi:hypothetical protein